MTLPTDLSTLSDDALHDALQTALELAGDADQQVADAEQDLRDAIKTQKAANIRCETIEGEQRRRSHAAERALLRSLYASDDEDGS